MNESSVAVEETRLPNSVEDSRPSPPVAEQASVVSDREAHHAQASLVSSGSAEAGNPLEAVRGAFRSCDAMLFDRLSEIDDLRAHDPKFTVVPPLPAGTPAVPSSFLPSRSKRTPQGAPRERVPYIPRRHMERETPPERLGRITEAQRFAGKQRTSYGIPAYDQACLKYIFSDSFESSIDLTEMVTVTTFLVAIMTNAASAAVNVASVANNSVKLDDSTEQWVIELSKVVFVVEFVTIWSMILFLVATVVDAVRKDNVGTDLASDFAALGKHIAGFSSIKIVGWISPAYAAQVIVPELKAAGNWRQYLRVCFFVLCYFGGCALAASTIILKVTQITFTAVEPVADWTSTQWLLLLGFILNLAKVDVSYETETSCLLCAVHRHFCRPGAPKDENPKQECLYTQTLQALGVEDSVHYELFEVVFDYHFDPVFSGAGRWKKALNFLSFILKLDNKLLRQYLQMISSPLAVYAAGRVAFYQGLKEGDLCAIDMSLWRSDPEDASLRQCAARNPSLFELVFHCDNPMSCSTVHSPWRVLNQTAAPGVTEDSSSLEDEETPVPAEQSETHKGALPGNDNEADAQVAAPTATETQ